MSGDVHVRFCESRGVRLPPATHLICHCVSKRQAEAVLAAIAARMEEVGLKLHPDKTKIVYAKDGTRRGDHEHTSFTFLGYEFRARKAPSRNGGYRSSFLPAMSTQARKVKGEQLRAMRIHRRVNLTLDDLARWLNPIVRGWMTYYGRFYRSEMAPLLQRLNTYLRRWAGRKYRRLRSHHSFRRWWGGLIDRQPALFAQWKWIRAF
jgi:RNA-directed DNA polymerase